MFYPNKGTCIKKGTDQREISHIPKLIKGKDKNDAYGTSSTCLPFNIFYSNLFGAHSKPWIMTSLIYETTELQHQ